MMLFDAAADGLRIFELNSSGPRQKSDSPIQSGDASKLAALSPAHAILIPDKAFWTLAGRTEGEG
jgi:hypothetical protein